MCRMFLQCSKNLFQIDATILKQFIKSCHWTYFKKYNVFGHHGLGWGFAYLTEDGKKLIIKRDINPIYKSKWMDLSKIKTRFLVVHARKSFPWQKTIRDVHPINISGEYIITHNGTIKPDSFDTLKDEYFEKTKNETNLDTRRYLSSILDYLKQGVSLKKSLEIIFKTIKIGLGANAFLFNKEKCNIICHHNTTFNGRHHALFLNKKNDTILIGTTPLKPKMVEIPNHLLIEINLHDLKTHTSSLEI